MAIEALTSDERKVVWECMNAILKGNFIDDYEFQTRLGVTKDQLEAVVASFSHLRDDDDESSISLGINNCLNEVGFGITFSDDVWSKWFSFSRDQVQKVYQKWAKLKGWKSTGLR